MKKTFIALFLATGLVLSVEAQAAADTHNAKTIYGKPTHCEYNKTIGEVLCTCEPGNACELTHQDNPANKGHYMLCIGAACKVSNNSWVDCVDGAQCTVGSNAISDCIDGQSECKSEPQAKNASIICRPNTICKVTTPDNHGVKIYCTDKDSCDYTPSSYPSVLSSYPIPQAYIAEYAKYRALELSRHNNK